MNAKIVKPTKNGTTNFTSRHIGSVYHDKLIRTNMRQGDKQAKFSGQ